MRLLVNFGPLKEGGGHNVAHNFLISLFSQKIDISDIFFLVAKGTDLQKFLDKNDVKNYKVVSRNPILRTLQELILVSIWLRVKKIDIVYSYFGYGFFEPRIKQVVGSADSNLYFPEIDFWQDETPVQKLKRKLVDIYRVFGIRRADAIVFENETLMKRGRELYNLDSTIFIPPSIAKLENETRTLSRRSEPHEDLRLLFLCGWQSNKNVMLIPKLVASFAKKGVDVTVVLTAQADGSRMCKQFMNEANNLGVSRNIELRGKVKKSELEELYLTTDFVMLLSRLESFSNNIIEAWYYKRPLVITNADWARSICQDAAVYVDRDSADAITSKILEIHKDPERIDKLTKRGVAMLKRYPNIQERTVMELQFLESLV